MSPEPADPDDATQRDGPVSVVIIDDHVLFAQGLQFVLEEATGGAVQVVAVSGDAGAAEELVRGHRPDLAVVDLVMPAPGGVAAIEAIKRHAPRVRVLVLSGVDTVEDAAEALAAGADGFLPKTADPDAVVTPLMAVLAGWTVLPRPLLDHLLSATRPDRRLVLEGLDEADVELWRLVAKGLETGEIAGRLFVSERTTKRMVAALLRRLGVANRIEAAALAGSVGLLDEPAPPPRSR